MFKGNLKFNILAISVSLMLAGHVFGQNMFYHLLGLQNFPNFTWTGATGDNLWTTAGNWSNGAVPGVSDDALFKTAACAGANCNVNIDANISIKGINIEAAYSGTITQNTTRTIIVGADGWTQAGGTFAGGDSNITINNVFTLSGGVFTATSAQMLVTSGFTYTAGTFNHNSGLLRFDNNGIVAGDSTINVALPGSVQLGSLQYSGGWASSTAGYTVNITSGSFDVQNQFEIGLTVGGANGGIYATGGTIYLKGNLVVDPQVQGTASTTFSNLVMDGTGAQTYLASSNGWVPPLQINKASGSVTPTGGTTNLGAYGFILTAGSFTAPPATFTVAGNFTIASGTTYTHNGGSLAFERFSGTVTGFTITLAGALTTNNLTFGGGRTGSVEATTWTIAGATPTINASGNLTISNTQAGGTGAVNIDGGAINVAGNYLPNAYSGAGTATLTFNGTGAQGFTKTGAGSTMGGTITVDKASGTLTLATAASFNTTGQDLTITTGTLNMAGFNLTINDILTVGANGKLICNGGTVSAASYVINGEVSCGTVIGISWTGLAGDNLWTTAGNWTNNTIPGASDIAIFNGSCSGANCNANIDANISVKGIKLNSDYTGTLTQNTTRTIAVGTSGWTQAGGTFAGGDSTITLTTGSFTLSGGAFTATSGILNLTNSHFIVSGSPTFTHNSGTLMLFPSSYSGAMTVTPGTLEYYNVTFKGNNTTYTLTGTMTVNGTLTFDDQDSGACIINTGIISAKGNVVFSSYGASGSGSAILKITGAGNQNVSGVSTAKIPKMEVISTGGTVTFSGSLKFYVSSYTYTSGTVDASTSTFIFTGGYNQTTTIVPGTVEYNHVTFTGNYTAYALTGTLNVNGVLTLTDTDSGSGRISGTVLAKGDVVLSGYGAGTGSGFLKIGGSGNQTITGVSTAKIPTFEVASTGGTVTYSGTLNFVKNYTYTSGTVDPGTSTALFQATQTIVPGAAVPFYNVTFGGGLVQTITGSMTVMGTLTLNDSAASSLNTGTVLAYGNVVSSNFGKGGSALIKVMGSTNQTITGVSTAGMGPFEMASTGGTVTLSGTVKFNRNVTYTSGTVDAGTSTVLISNCCAPYTITPGTVAFNNVTFNSTGTSNYTLVGTMTVNGTLTLGDTSSSSGPINTGTFEANSHVIYNNYGYYGSAAITMSGAVSSNLTIAAGANRPSGTITVAKTGGASVVMLSNASYGSTGQDVTVSSGTLNLSGYDLTVTDTLTVASGATVQCSGGAFTAGTVSNSGTINCTGYGGYTGYAFSWKGGGGDSNWNTAANWNGGVVPGASDVVEFDATICGANCNATINTAASVRGMRMASGYGGTITQGSGITVAVGGQGWAQAGGTFTGSDAAITSGGKFILSAGTFTASPSLTLNNSSVTAGMNLIQVSGGTWTAPTNLAVNVAFTGCSSGTVYIDVPTTLTLNNITLNSTAGCGSLLLTVAAGDTVHVTGNMTQTNGAFNGAWTLDGNLVVGASADSGTGTITMIGTGAQTYLATSPGSTSKLVINKASGAVTQDAPATNYLAVASFALTQGSFSAPTDMTLNGTFTSTGNTIFQVASGTTFSAPTNLNVNVSYTGCGSSTYYADVPTSLTVNNLSLNSTNGCNPVTVSTAAGDTINVSGNITHTNGAFAGTWTLAGNYTAVTGAGGGSGVLTFTGSGTQTVTHSGGTAIGGDLTVNKSGGSVLLASATSFNTAGQDLTITAGTVDMAGYALTVNGAISNSGTLKRGNNPSCGTLTYGSYSGTAAICP